MWLCTVVWLVVQFPCRASSLHAEEITPHKSHTTESLQCSGHGWISHHYHRVKQQQLGAGKKQMCRKTKPCTCGKAEGREMSFVFGGQLCDNLQILAGLRLEGSFEVGRTAQSARWALVSSWTFHLETRKTTRNFRQIGQQLDGYWILGSNSAKKTNGKYRTY